MAESHSEDAPLLDSGEPTTPSDTFPDSRNPSAPWSSPHHHGLVCGPHRPWPPDTWEAPVQQRDPEKLNAPPGEESDGPKLVRSQSSMDSGCECDTTDLEGGQEVSVHHLHEEKNCTPQDMAGMSPLSPSQPDGCDMPSPGLSCCTTVGTLTPNSCQLCGGSQNCACDIRGAMGGATGTGVHAAGDARVPTHTDRGLLTASHAKVTFKIEGYEDDSVSQDRCLDVNVPLVISPIETASPSGSEPGEDFKEHLVRFAAPSFPRVPSYTQTGVLSTSSSTASLPMCRICHLPQGDGIETLISPCRCAGTMQFIHHGCLMRWLEVSSKKSKKAPTCELCNYQFTRHKKFRLRHWQLPHCSRLDKVLHSVFLVCLVVMATCAAITVICFKQDKVPTGTKDAADLTKSEVITLTCGILFFVAFFVAMYVEVKAHDTLYRLFHRFMYLNQTWHIEEYDKHRDKQYCHAPV